MRGFVWSNEICEVTAAVASGRQQEELPVQLLEVGLAFATARAEGARRFAETYESASAQELTR